MNEKTDISGALAALSLLLENPEAAVEQIDAEIELLMQQIADLQRQRKILIPASPKKQTAGTVTIKHNVSERIDILVGALRQAGESMPPKALAMATDIPYCIIGKLVDVSDGRLKRSGHHIALGDE